MEWTHITVDTLPGAIDVLAEQLAVRGYESLEIEDETQFGSFADENERYWGRPDEEQAEKLRGVCRVGMYTDRPFEDEEPGLRSALEEIRQALPGVRFGSLAINADSVDDSSWRDRWKEYFNPTPVGEKLIIVPGWMDPPADTGRIPLRIDPGVTFGTGTHATTGMCIRAAERLVKGGELVYDLGCGSGILSIAALLLGARKAVGVDIDPLAVSVSAENAAANGFGEERYEALLADVGQDNAAAAEFARQPCDLLFANIVADVLVSLAPRARSFIREGGAAVCSGIIEEKLGAVREAMEAAGFTVEAVTGEDGWNAMICRA